MKIAKHGPSNEARRWRCLARKEHAKRLKQWRERTEESWRRAAAEERRIGRIYNLGLALHRQDPVKHPLPPKLKGMDRRELARRRHRQRQPDLATAPPELLRRAHD